MWRTIGRVLTRKKVLDPVSAQESSLARVLNTYDLTFLGIGSTLGVGMYVLVGHVAKDIAGPAVILSFLIAAVASAFAGLCYAELGARAPRAGSAYIYSYVCVGEFIAFVIGWNLILEYVIGSASVARGLSLYLDTLVNNTLKNTFIEIAPIHVPFMSAYFDFLSFGMSFLLSLALAFGMKESSIVNNVFTLVNLGIVVFIVIAGSIEAHGSNWAVNPANTSVPNGTDIGNGYFFPFGIGGMIKGAATCFYGFVGFDCIATTGEEVKNPQRAIPVSIVMSLVIIFLAYMGTSTVVTLMVPYYAQDVNAPIPHAFEECGLTVGKWIVAIGAIFGLCISLFGAMFPLPRIIYAMASDGIIFRFLGYVNSRFQTPVIGTLLAGILTGLMGALFELKNLVDMMSIGTLLAYTIVAASVLLLRFEADEPVDYLRINAASESDESDTYTENQAYNEEGEELSDENQLITPEGISVGLVLKQIFNCGRYENPNKISEKLVSVEVLLYCVCCIFIGLGALLLQKGHSLQQNIPIIVLTSIFAGLAVMIIISISLQPVSKRPLYFKVPFVPFIPAVSILVNIYLMLMLDTHTWIRFGVWMAIGLPTYFISVSTVAPSARNESISSKMGPLQKGLINGYANGAYMHEENEKWKMSEEEGDKQAKENGVPSSNTAVNTESKNIIESADKVLNQLDAILESEICHDSNSVDDKIGDGNFVDTVSRQSVNVDVSNNTLNTCFEPCMSDIASYNQKCVVVDVHHSSSSTPTSPTPKECNSVDKIVNEKDVSTDLKPIESKSHSNDDTEENMKENQIVNEVGDQGNNDIENSKRDENLYVFSKDNASESANISESETSKISDEQNLDPIMNTDKKDRIESQECCADDKNIPIPPVFPKSELFNDMNIPRPKIKDLKKMKLILKNVNRPKSPPIDYDKKSDLDSPTELPEGNLKMGSTQFTKFLQKLERKLQKPAPITYKNSFTSSEKMKSRKKKPVEIPRDSVDEDHINKANVKKLLQSFLVKQITNRDEIRNATTNDTDRSKENCSLESSNSGADENIEMSPTEKASLVNTIQKDEDAESKDSVLVATENATSQKESSPSSPLSDDKTVSENNFFNYKKNMDEIIKTIKLRKVESFEEAKA